MALTSLAAILAVKRSLVLVGISGSSRCRHYANVAASAPYMHDGSLATLQDVIEQYTRGVGEIPPLTRRSYPFPCQRVTKPTCSHSSLP